MKRKKIFSGVCAFLAIILIFAAHYRFDPWGFYWKVSQEEAALRLSLVEAAQSYLGCNEADGSHMQIVDLYNAHEPLAMGYAVQENDSWCAAFVSAAAIQEGLTDIIPTECGCERQIGLFQTMGRWEENDNTIPLPGDLIYYDWNTDKLGENTGWADHVGIVVGTKWPFVKVIEGNKDDMVTYRVILLGDVHIRGYGRPDYTSFLSATAGKE